MVPTIVVIDDDQQLLDYLKDLFKSTEEMNVKGFTSGISGLNYLKNETPKLVLLDLSLEDIHGSSLVGEIRKIHSNLPIVILTGDDSNEMLIRCLNMGADDYITKPFNNDELIARVKSKLRNLRLDDEKEILMIQDLVLNPETLEVKKAGKPVTLTGKEFQLLHYLMINSHRVCTRDKILFSVWGYSADIDTRVVDVHIAKLRKKLKDKNTNYIQSLRGFGYRMVET
jgi:DNA-binding response OmpR family regulator